MRGVLPQSLLRHFLCIWLEILSLELTLLKIFIMQNPPLKFVSSSVRSWMQIAVLSTELPQSLFHFNKFWVSRETSRQWKLYSTCQTCCYAFFETPQNGGKEVKVFYLTCLLFHLVQLLCESLSFKMPWRGKLITRYIRIMKHTRWKILFPLLFVPYYLDYQLL